ncbi:DUF1707 domain-containing protein [Streptomyces sp. NPDC008001]|uniref:DUF1707 SHOCT-like domain-containing protein n=1 Tax=Streptomyces sp. NPDC008001 TaxID=3364804 RepID=UPI0036EFD199
MMSELPEMRASDAERERVAEALREGVAEGRLTMEEFEERLEAAYKARTHGELEPLVRDLPAPGGHAAVSLTKRAGESAPAGRDWAGRIGGPAGGTVAVGVMGGFQRKGAWTVPRRFTAFAFWGGGEIDLRDARFEDGEIVIHCIAVMGGIQVVVPPDLDVHVGGIGIMGGFDDKASGPGTPGSPRVRVTGFAFWGGVGVDRKVSREERKRLREERREDRRKSLG